MMTDTEMLDWIQKHLFQLREIKNEEFVMTWVNDDGSLQFETHGHNLRDCIKNTIEGNTWF